MKRNYLFIIIIFLVANFLARPVKTEAALVGDSTQAVLSLSPQTGTFNVNDTFTVSIIVNTNNQNVNAVAAYLNYDSADFQAVSVDTTGSDFTLTFDKSINAMSGTIKITQTIPKPGINIANGLVTKINFKALNPTNPVANNLIFDFTPGSTLDSNVLKNLNPGDPGYENGTGSEILSGVNNAKYIVVASGTAPILSFINVTAITTSGATINWNTDKFTNAQVEYGTTASYGATTSVDTSTSTSHSVALNGLSANTSYHYRVISKDSLGNIATSSDNIFTTSAQSSGGNSSGGGGGGGGYTPPSQTTTVYNQKPQNIVINSSSNALTLTWRNPVDANYNKTIIVRSSDTLSDYMTYQTISGLGSIIYQGTGTTFAETNLAPNLNYYYAIFAADKSAHYSNPIILMKAANFNNAGASSNNQNSSSFNGGVFNLATATKAEVEEVTLNEAQTVYQYNKFVNLNSTTRVLYTFILGRSPQTLTDQDKYAIAYYINNGTASTLKLGAGERTGVLNSYLTVFYKLPNNESEWQDVIKIANGRWPDEKNSKAETRAQNDWFVKIYKRKANMINSNDNVAVSVIAYGLRPGLRKTESEKAAIQIFNAIFKYNPSNAVDWDIVRAIAYSGAKR